MKKILSLIMAIILTGMVFLPMKSQASASVSGAGAVAVSSGKLNVRSSNSTNSAVVASLEKNSFVTLISKTGSWWRVEYAKSIYGYCHADYIQSFRAIRWL